MQNGEMINQKNHTIDFDTNWHGLPTMIPIPPLILISFPMPMGMWVSNTSIVQSIEYILQDIGQQALDTKYSLSLGQLIKIMMLVGEWMSMWTGSCEQKKILKNIPCHVLEYSQYIHLPYGNNIWCGKIFHALSWNILPHHMWDLLQNQ